jgi:hypothetical protein
MRRLGRLKDRKLNRKAPSNPALSTVVERAVTLNATLPTEVDVVVREADRGTLRTLGEKPQSTVDCETQLHAIVPWKPLSAVTDIGVTAVCPWPTDNGETEKLKSAGPRTVCEIACDVLPSRLESPL